MKAAIMMTAFAVSLITGCSSQNKDQASYNLRNDRSEPQYMSNPTSDGKEKRHLVEQDLTNQNPNFLNLDRTGSGSETGSSLGADVDKARQTILATKKFSPGAVWINGDVMNVTVYPKTQFNRNERYLQKETLRKKLMEALPRYHMKINVKENWR